MGSVSWGWPCLSLTLWSMLAHSGKRASRGGPGLCASGFLDCLLGASDAMALLTTCRTPILVLKQSSCVLVSPAGLPLRVPCLLLGGSWGIWTSPQGLGFCQLMDMAAARALASLLPLLVPEHFHSPAPHPRGASFRSLLPLWLNAASFFLSPWPTLLSSLSSFSSFAVLEVFIMEEFKPI